MNKREFLIKIGLGAGVAITSPVVFSRCQDETAEDGSADDDDSTDDGSADDDDSTDDGSSDDGVDFTVDLNADDNSDLQQEGGYIYKNSIIIAYLGNDEYFALSKVCTHNQCDVEYNADEDLVVCPCHGSEFTTDGSVSSGPAEEPLKEYNTELNDNMLRVYE